jgi:hypothetical protein
MYLRVTETPRLYDEDVPISDDTVEAIRFMDERCRSMMDLLRGTCWELAQYQSRCEELERRLAKHEWVGEFEPKPYIHAEVRCDE